MLSARRVLLEALGQRRRPARTSGDNENRVIARDGAYGLRQLRSVERLGQSLRLAPPGTDDDELIDPLDPAEKLDGRSLQRAQNCLGVRRVRARAPVRAVSGTLHEPQIRNVARDRRLRGVESTLTETPTQLLLAVEGVAIDEIKDERLAACLYGHGSA
jgi:hypothetical protein